MKISVAVVVVVVVVVVVLVYDDTVKCFRNISVEHDGSIFGLT